MSYDGAMPESWMWGDEVDYFTKRMEEPIGHCFYGGCDGIQVGWAIIEDCEVDWVAVCTRCANDPNLIRPVQRYVSYDEVLAIMCPIRLKDTRRFLYGPDTLR